MERHAGDGQRRHGLREIYRANTIRGMGMKGVTQQALEHYEDREHSLVKHAILASYLQRCLMIVGQWSSKIAYIDCFAGPWKSQMSDLSDTSPGIAIHLMADCQATLQEKHHKQVRVRSVFVESDAQRADLLDAHVQQAPTNIVRPEIWRKSFQDAIPEILAWLEPDEFAFVFVDPFGWKDVIESSVLAPFLKRDRTELLITFMWNFINLATGHTEQEANLTAVFGKDWQAANAYSGDAKHRQLMRRYRQQLTTACDGSGLNRLRTAVLPVEYANKKKVIFNLVYATHNATGLVVFWEQAEHVVAQQSRLKLQHRLDHVAKQHGQNDLFNADAHQDEPHLPSYDLKQAWLARLPNVDDVLVVDTIVMADLIEATDGLLSDLQKALGELIKDGTIENVNAKRPRKVHVVNYRNKEQLRRLK
ncbi:three-Cys-motif partner protein TcmP [Dyella subtropica]|uniref:three-Cys-motif partner protein TcmP n=1 Tax=Dyella subtropica TaxID=2992127 RepID=UPI00225C06BC|nr:three-Cys-motif partner protein TcmP [Dyella subtropica]